MVCAFAFGGGAILLGFIALLFMLSNFFRFISATMWGTLAWAVWNYMVVPWAGWNPVTWWAAVGIAFLLLMIRGIFHRDEKVVIKFRSPPTEPAERIVRR